MSKMQSGMLSASPSWYCSRVSDCHPKGTFVYGAKNNIYLLDISGESPVYKDNVEVHKDRVAAISLCHQVTDTILCCTSSDDKKVRIWDLEKKELKEEHQYHKNQPTAVHWSRKCEDLIISGDDRGELIVWNLATRTVQQFAPERAHVFCLEWSTVNPNLVAVGYKTGTIIVFDVQRKGQILQRLRGHDEEVHSVKWCPLPGENIKLREEGETEDDVEAGSDLGPNGHLLASGSRDRTVRVWSTMFGRAVQTFKLPTNTGFGRRRGDDQSHGRDRVWVTVDWVPNQPRQLLSSTHSGEMLHWDLCKPGKQKYDMFGGLGHTRIIFNIAVLDNMACSISMDRNVVVWDIKARSSKHIIPTLGGFAYALVSSPLNPGRVAIGVGDNMIRVWNLSNTTNFYDVSTHWQGIKSKVTCLCWHPEKESLLAYGTDDGRVGIADVLSGKSPSISSTYHKRTVYVVAWGPNCPYGDDPSKKDQMMLYSCGDGVVLQHNPKKLDKEASKFCSAINAANGPNYKGGSRSEINWKPDNSLVVLGNEDGTIDVYRSKDLKLLCSVHVHHKIVNVCRWHPEYLVHSDQPSSCRFWLATGSNEGTIHVLDLQKVIENDSEESAVITESLYQLEGHTTRVTGLSWSVHEEGMLASSSYDGTAQVWNVKTNKGIANFRGHCNRVMSVLWSAVDSKMIFSGGDDFTVRFWRTDEQEHKVPPKAVKKGKSKKKTGSEITPPQLASDQTISAVQQARPAEKQPGKSAESSSNLDMDEINKMLEQRKKELLQMQESQKEEVKNGREEETEDQMNKPKSQPLMLQTGAVKKEGHKESRQKRKAKALFPTFGGMENRGKVAVLQDCVDLTSHLFEQKEQNGDSVLADNLSHLGAYTNRKNTYQFIDKEAKHHEENGNIEQQTYLDMWTGNITGVLERAKNSHQLNDWIVALAPLASPKIWRETCESYAKILASDGNVYKAVTYLLAAKMVKEAISMLVAHKLYKEAVHLAQARLAPSDPLLTSLYQQWGAHLTSEGNYESAAKCYLAVKNPIEAAKVLARRHDLLSLKTAIQITLIAGENAACQTYIVKYLQDCLLKYKWLSALEISQLHQTAKWLCLPVIVHEALVLSLSSLGLYELDQNPEPCCLASPYPKKLPRLLTVPEKVSSLCPWNVFLKDGQSLPLHIISRWLKEIQIDLDREQLNQCTALLKQIRETKQSNTQQKQVLIAACLEVSLGLVGLLQCDMDSATYWLTTAMSTCHAAGHQSLLQGLCQTLLPLGPENLPQLQQQVTALRLAAKGDSVGIQAADLSRRPSVAFDLESCGGDTKDLVIGNSTEMCTSVDCLAAYFYTAVLHYLEKDQKGNASTEASHVNGAENGSGVDGQDVKENGGPGEAGDASSIGETSVNGVGDVGASSEGPSQNRLVRLSHYLLWESQAKRKELLACIDSIKQKLTSTLKDGESLDELLGAIQKQRQISRAASGEYLPMTPVKKTLSREGSYNTGSDFLERSFAGSECEWVDMRDSPMKSDPALSNGLLNDSSPDLTHSMSTSSVQIYTKAHSIFSDLSQSVLLSGASMSEQDDADVGISGIGDISGISDLEANLKDLNDSDGTLNDSGATLTESTEHIEASSVDINVDNVNEEVVKESSVNDSPERDEGPTVTFSLGNADGDPVEDKQPTDETSQPADLWPNQPEDWKDLPVDVRYGLPGVPPTFLVREYQKIEQMLHLLNTKLPPDCPFPDVIESCNALMAMSASTDPEDSDSFKQRLSDWALAHSYLAKHRSAFSSKQPEQNEEPEGVKS